jgi:hypothetical protein
VSGKIQFPFGEDVSMKIAKALHTGTVAVTITSIIGIGIALQPQDSQ